MKSMMKKCPGRRKLAGFLAVLIAVLSISVLNVQTAHAQMGGLVSPRDGSSYVLGSSVDIDIRPFGSIAIGGLALTGTCEIESGGSTVYSKSISTSSSGGPLLSLTDTFTPDKTGTYTINVELEYRLTGRLIDTSSYTASFTVVSPAANGNTQKPGNSDKPGNSGKPGKTSAAVHRVGAFSYTVKDGKATVKAASRKTSQKFTIPSTVSIKGKKVPVTAISANAFKNMKKLSNVTIGKNIRTVGKNAFYGCKNLKKITIKTKKLTKKSIGSNAFKGIYKKAVIQSPKTRKAIYKEILLKKGMKKTMKFR